MDSKTLLKEMSDVSKGSTSYENAKKLSDLYTSWKALKHCPWEEKKQLVPSGVPVPSVVPVPSGVEENKIKESVLAGAQYIQNVENYSSDKQDNTKEKDSKEKDCLIKKYGRLEKEYETLKAENENLEKEFDSLMDSYYKVSNERDNLLEESREKAGVIGELQAKYDSLYASQAGTPDTVTIKCEDLKQITTLSKGQIIALIDEYFTESKKFHCKDYNRFLQFVKGKFRNSPVPFGCDDMV